MRYDEVGFGYGAAGLMYSKCYWHRMYWDAQDCVMVLEHKKTRRKYIILLEK
jgi:hypothetical protein